MTVPRKTRKWLYALLFILGLMIICVALFPLYMQKLGKREILAIAHESGYCITPGCVEGQRSVIGVFKDDYGLNEQDVAWCLATNVIYTTNMGFINDFKNRIADNYLYPRCNQGELTLDDANIDIYFPGDHHH